MTQGLILKYLSDTCSAEEKAQVQTWLEGDKVRSVELLRMQKIWQGLKGISSHQVYSESEEWNEFLAILDERAKVENEKRQEPVQKHTAITKPPSSFESVKEIEKNSPKPAAIQEPFNSPILKASKPQTDSKNIIYGIATLLGMGFIILLLWKFINNPEIKGATELTQEVREIETEEIDKTLETESLEYEFDPQKTSSTINSATQDDQYDNTAIIGTSSVLISLESLLDWMMENSDWKVISSPGMPLDANHKVNVDLSSGYLNVLEQLATQINLEYKEGGCPGCVEIRRMKAQ